MGGTLGIPTISVSKALFPTFLSFSDVTLPDRTVGALEPMHDLHSLQVNTASLVQKVTNMSKSIQQIVAQGDILGELCRSNSQGYSAGHSIFALGGEFLVPFNGSLKDIYGALKTMSVVSCLFKRFRYLA